MAAKRNVDESGSGFWARFAVLTVVVLWVSLIGGNWLGKYLMRTHPKFAITSEDDYRNVADQRSRLRGRPPVTNSAPSGVPDEEQTPAGDGTPAAARSAIPMKPSAAPSAKASAARPSAMPTPSRPLASPARPSATPTPVAAKPTPVKPKPIPTHDVPPPPMPGPGDRHEPAASTPQAPAPTPVERPAAPERATTPERPAAPERATAPAPKPASTPRTHDAPPPTPASPGGDG